MPLNEREFSGRITKLRKSLKSLSKNPTVDDVHDLRTRTRRVESILRALEFDRSNAEERLVEGLKAVRKKAGAVRDMDVLTSHIVGLGLKDDPNCVVRLLHHLGNQRRRGATKLYSTVNHDRSRLRGQLKRAKRQMDAELITPRQRQPWIDTDPSQQAPVHAMSNTLVLARELAEVKRLGRDNLHQYRIGIKQLRYLLEMADESEGSQRDFLRRLSKVQDAIGEWHDWVELEGIAGKVLKHDLHCRLRKKIHDTSERKFAEALRLTEQMRHRYLTGHGPANKRVSKKSKDSVPMPVLAMASEMAA